MGRILLFRLSSRWTPAQGRQGRHSPSRPFRRTPTRGERERVQVLVGELLVTHRYRETRDTTRVDAVPRILKGHRRVWPVEFRVSRREYQPSGLRVLIPAVPVRGGLRDPSGRNEKTEDHRDPQGPYTDVFGSGTNTEVLRGRGGIR